MPHTSRQRRQLLGLPLAKTAEGSFDALFLAEPGLKAALAQLHDYAGVRLRLRPLEAEVPH